jgi:hypothetical protein
MVHPVSSGLDMLVCVLSHRTEYINYWGFLSISQVTGCMYFGGSGLSAFGYRAQVLRTE